MPTQPPLDETTYARLVAAFVREARAGAFDGEADPNLPELPDLPDTGDETVALVYEPPPADPA